MCGISAFVSHQGWKQPADPSPLREVVASLGASLGAFQGASGASAASRWSDVDAAVERLASAFATLQSFGLFAEVTASETTAALLSELAGALDALHHRATEEAAATGAEAGLMATAEKLADYAWQVRVEVLGAVAETERLLPRPARQTPRPALFAAWSIARVLAAIDRLEVRGRDSLGLAVALRLEPGTSIAPRASRDELRSRTALDETATGRLTVIDADAPMVRAVYKVANLVGRLGDNADGIRAALKSDTLFWDFAAATATVNVVAHTRWASNGIISIANSHPVDGVVLDGAGARTGGDRILVSVNGDVDNYRYLVDNTVTARGLRLHPAASTDAKIFPVLYGLDGDARASGFDRFVASLRACQGSLAVVAQSLDEPDALFVGQKGSGQALYAGATADGWLVASEVYGLAAMCRTHVTLSAAGEDGAALRLGVGPEGDLVRHGCTLTGGRAYEPDRQPIQIFSRDIDRGGHDLYILKEINEAPLSVRRTVHGKYRRGDGSVEWLMDGFGRGPELLARLRDGRPLRRIVCVGQGTAAIAAMGVAACLRRALQSVRIQVESGTASELFGFVGNDHLDDVILVAVSQSGTTTDTNRVVDIARERGAWVHAIVNRRNSALVHKADSHLYTSSGRDVEMSVASTKAFYSQVAAGKLLALLLADELQAMSKADIVAELRELEALEDRLRAVLREAEAISAVAKELATGARNWAVVGNGPNRIAAEEIRIKLSELCYKAIPCDVTENKKHVDLSTEPLTLVIANDLPEMVVQDTVKEVAIFRAHNGHPVVVCQRGETRFDDVAERTIVVPAMGAGLGFVVATMAGHLFGIAAARAIDAAATPFRRVRAHLSEAAGASIGAQERTAFAHEVRAALHGLAGGAGDSALPASLVIRLAAAANALESAGSDDHLAELTRLVVRCIEELTRPIDAIRHQAKTVTVGISRPAGELSAVIAAALADLACDRELLPADEHRRLVALSPVVTAVSGGLVYEVLPATADPAEAGPRWMLHAVAGYGASRPQDSRYAVPLGASGSKRAALRRRQTVCRPADPGVPSGGQVVIPVRGAAGDTVRRLVLLHLVVAPDASLQQKTTLLQALGDRYEDLRDRLDEQGLPTIDDVLMRLPLARAVFGGDEEILAEAAALAAARRPEPPLSRGA